MLSPVIKVNEEKCINCHMCISVCPVKFCIDGSGDKVAINHDLCIGCGKCIEACTANARGIIDDTAEAFASLKRGDKIIAVAAPAFISSFKEQYGNIIGWLKQSGVSAVFDVSLGAELTVKSYLEHIKKDKPALVIAQPCPAIVSYIEIYKPELISKLAPADSPMLHLIKMIKAFYPEYKKHKVMVLSPCIAKRREFDDTGLADFNVTLAELKQKIDDEKIRLSSFTPMDFDNPPAERAALFCSPGGLMKTVLRERPELEDKIRKIEGQPEIYSYLEKLPESIKNGTNPLLVDCLNCSKGCNGGSGTLNQDVPVDDLEYIIRNRTEILKNNYRSKLTGKTSVRKINKLIEKYWKEDLYIRKYRNRSEHNSIKQPSQTELNAIYREMKKDREEDFLNCAACGYNSCEVMAVAIFNGLNKPENCHHYKHRIIEIEKRILDELNLQLKEKINQSEGLISGVSDSLINVSSNMDNQSRSLENSSDEVEKMLRSFNTISDKFSVQNENLNTLVTKARNGQTELKSNAKAIRKITDGVGQIGEMIGMINDISQQTNLLSMNAAIEAAHAGASGRGFAVVASEIKKLAGNTALKANEVGESLNLIISEADTTSRSSDNTSSVIMEIINNILQITEEMNLLFGDINEMASGSNTIMDSLRTLKSDNEKVVSSASQIKDHVGELNSNMISLKSKTNNELN